MRTQPRAIVAADPTTALIFERLQAIEGQLVELKRLAELHWGDEERRFRLIDRFLDPTMDLESILSQIAENGRTHNQLVARLEGALQLTLATTDLVATDRN